MKRRVIEKIPVPEWNGNMPEGKSYALTCQTYKEGIVLDAFNILGQHLGRYAMNTQTGEYETCKNGGWSKSRFLTVLGKEPLYFSSYQIGQMVGFATEEDGQRFEAEVSNGFYGLSSMETDYQKDKRVRTIINRYERYEELMARIPPRPEGLKDWVLQMERRHFTFKDAGRKEYHCSNCKHVEKLKKGPKNNEVYVCPSCGAVTTVKTRSKKEWIMGRVAVMQTLEGGKESVVRHFKYALRYWLEETGEGGLEAGEEFYLEEQVRLIMHQSGGCSIFYEQDGRTYEWWTGLYRPTWSHQNPANKRMKECYLYPEGIAEALKGTSYGSLARAFEAMAAGRIKGKYNEVMCVGFHRLNLGNVLELLYKRGFRKLVQETMNNCDVWNGNYYGSLNIDEQSEKHVFGLQDKQKINRIRQNDGGERYLRWMKEAEAYDIKLTDKFMEWACRHGVDPDMFEEFPNTVRDNMSYEKIMNYIERQKPYMPPHYRGQVYSTIETWLDYLDMCIIAGVKIKDSLFYAPKDLKGAHDSMVVEKEKLEILRNSKANKEYKESRAQEVREKFPEAQNNLLAIAEKYEYTGEEYLIKIPRDLYEIVEEGQALHHCGGSSDRYFSRIENRETYIGFLRRAGEEGLPYYTIEFEPDGTIRQSRSFHDEEPEIELIRPFLKEWQQVVKKRLTEEDRKDAKRSAELRQKNIEELKEKKNTFVLSKLEEDFMEAV